jgi:GNAT superfamily N-acetyltransferase
MPLNIRSGRPEDCPTLVRFVRELAEFERAPDAARASAEDFLRDGFGPVPRFESLIAEVDATAAGFALFFHNYSTWEGCCGIYIEDLYVTPSARGRGIGGALLARVAALAVERGCRRLDLSVLHWNPAREIYAAMGFEHLREWEAYRLQGDPLKALARKAL